MVRKDARFEGLPDGAARYVKSVARRVSMGLKVNREVCNELIDHFTYALRDCSEGDKSARAEQLIADFGSPKLLGKLIRRGKMRCRPLWRKAITRGFQGVGLLILLYGLWVTTGTPTISVDYVARLNELARPGVPEDQNAWPHYKRAMTLYVEPGQVLEESPVMDYRISPGHYAQVTYLTTAELTNLRKWLYAELADLTTEQLADLRKWLDDNEPAWQEFEAGSREPYCWCEFPALKPGEPLLQLKLPPLRVARVKLPRLSHLEWLGRAGAWRSRIVLEEGKVSEAVDSLLASDRAGMHLLSGRGMLIEQLVGMGIGDLACQELLRLARADGLAAGDLARAQAGLEAVSAGGFPPLSCEGERLVVLDVVQLCFTEGGPGGGHLIPGRVAPYLHFRPNYPPDLLPPIVPAILMSAVGGGRGETVSAINEYFDLVEARGKLTPYMLREGGLQGWSRKYIESVGGPLNDFVDGQCPSVTYAGEFAFRAKATHEATIAVLALRRWRVERGKYPDDLRSLLEAGYLEALPQDPYSDGPLRYARRGEDFILYSVGANFRDDGGASDPERPWGVTNTLPDTPGLDHVFWPLPERGRAEVSLLGGSPPVEPGRGSVPGNGAAGETRPTSLPAGSQPAEVLAPGR